MRIVVDHGHLVRFADHGYRRPPAGAARPHAGTGPQDRPGVGAPPGYTPCLTGWPACGGSWPVTSNQRDRRRLGRKEGAPTATADTARHRAAPVPRRLRRREHARDHTPRDYYRGWWLGVEGLLESGLSNARTEGYRRVIKQVSVSAVVPQPDPLQAAHHAPHRGHPGRAGMHMHNEPNPRLSVKGRSKRVAHVRIAADCRTPTRKPGRARPPLLTGAAAASCARC